MASYFCYEKTFTGSWQPVIYHKDKPLAKSSNGQIPERTALNEVPEGADLTKLMELFPAPLVP